ncbi:EAL domain-containing protein [Billgrantia endophytica]|nr:EAL domain-containing protein [Halomonas endophytica]
MKSVQGLVSSLVHSLGLDEASISNRKAFLQFGRDDIERLKRLHRALEELDHPFAEDFYEHLLQFEETRSLIPDTATLQRLQASQTAYFDTLTAGDYGERYVHHRLKVGIVHQRIGLDPTWYLGAYAHYLVGLLPTIHQRLEGGHGELIATLQSLIKIVLFDMSLAIDTYNHASKQTILALKRYTELVFAHIPDGLVVLSTDLTILSANRAFLRQLDLDPEQVHGQPLLSVVRLEQEFAPPDSFIDLAKATALDHSVHQDLIYRLGKPGDTGGKPVSVTLTGIVHEEGEEGEGEGEGEEAGLLVIIKDLTEWERQERALRESQAMLIRAQAVAGIGSWSWDLAENHLSWSAETYRIFGVTTSQAPSCGAVPVHSEDLSMVTDAWRKTLEDGTPYNVDYRIVPGGETRWVNVRAELEVDADGVPLRAVGTVLDITDRKRADDKIQHLAFYDSLTNLPNRALCLDRLQQAISAAERHRETLSVLFIDLDLFKHINDSLGHATGDRLLQAVATRLRGSVRRVDTVARLGGDEFVVLLQEVREDTVTAIAEKILAALHRPYFVDDQTLHVTCSIGIALYPRDGEDTQALLRNADAAMYRAKAKGRNNAQFYTKDLNRKARERLQIQEEMYVALERQQFVLHYQPQLDLQSGHITALEALVRWQHPEHGLIAPDRFISVAEETGLIVPLGEWVIRQACLFSRQLEATLGHPIKIAVNLSARQFWQSDLAERLAGILQQTGLAPARLEIEITESMIMHQVDQAILTMCQINALGVSLVIDDFGTGFSSLNHLKRFPVQVLKIDKSFVSGVPGNADDTSIVAATIGLAHNMGLKIVAEGIETDAQLAFMREHRCDEIQGYLFARPMARSETLSFIGSYIEAGTRWDGASGLLSRP